MYLASLQHPSGAEYRGAEVAFRNHFTLLYLLTLKYRIVATWESMPRNDRYHRQLPS